jgi:hypothetical protein
LALNGRLTAKLFLTNLKLERLAPTTQQKVTIEDDKALGALF